MYFHNSLFYSARPKAGDIVWEIPIRFYDEGAKPEWVVVMKDCEQDSKSVYVYKESYGHNVYLGREFICFDRETAVKVIEHLNALHNLMEDDLMEVVMQNIFDKKVIK